MWKREPDTVKYTAVLCIRFKRIAGLETYNKRTECFERPIDHDAHDNGAGNANETVHDCHISNRTQAIAELAEIVMLI